MNDVSNSPFGPIGDLVDAVFGQGPLAKKRAEPQPQADPPQREQPKLPQLRSKRIDGVLYVRAEDVADLLEKSVPDKTRPLIRRLRGQR